MNNKLIWLALGAGGIYLGYGLLKDKKPRVKHIDKNKAIQPKRKEEMKKLGNGLQVTPQNLSLDVAQSAVEDFLF